jgi:hypothetical protein
MGHPTVRRPPIDPTRVEAIEVVANPTATHLRFRVPARGPPTPDPYPTRKKGNPTMTTTSVPHQHGARATHSLWRYGPIAIAAAAAATALVAATARAADVPLTIDGEQIPVAGFVTNTVLACSIGLLLAGALGRWAPRPRATFTWAAVALTVASFIPSLTADTDTATKVVLVTSHVVAAAIVIPVFARSLPPRRPNC